MQQLIGPVLAGFALLAASTAIGIPMIRKMVMVREAKHELREGSAGFLRSIAGWAVVAIWVLGTWYVATIVGDWFMTGDLAGAVERSMRRLQVVFEIVIALMATNFPLPGLFDTWLDRQVNWLKDERSLKESIMKMSSIR